MPKGKTGSLSSWGKVKAHVIWQQSTQVQRPVRDQPHGQRQARGWRDERNRNQGTQTELLVGEDGGWDVIWPKRCSKRRGDGGCVAHVTAYTVWWTKPPLHHPAAWRVSNRIGSLWLVTILTPRSLQVTFTMGGLVEQSDVLMTLYCTYIKTYVLYAVFPYHICYIFKIKQYFFCFFHCTIIKQ